MSELALFPEATQEQRMMADSAIRVMEAEYPLAKVRESAERSEPGCEKLWRKLADLGCFRLLAAESHGGGTLSGNGVADAALIAAERGARLQPGPFVGAHVVAATLSGTLRAAVAGQPATAAQDLAPLPAEALEALLSGRATATWAPGGLLARPGQPGLVVREEPGALLVSGAVTLVQDADQCDWFLVSTRDGQVTRQFLLARSAAGLSLEKAESLDITRRFFDLRLDDVRVPAEAVVGDAVDAAAVADRQVALAAVLSAAESVGAMDANFSLALEYSKTRIAFGRPIGSFQGLKHLLAGTSLMLEMSKGMVAGAAAALGDEAADGLTMASIARALVSQQAVELTHNCFQVFGGIGFTWEHDQHLYMRRLASEAYLFGSPDWHRQRIWQQAVPGAEAAKEMADV
jgi:alkylation response protein AidB-like acyl-CoA dehydrogenase